MYHLFFLCLHLVEPSSHLEFHLGSVQLVVQDPLSGQASVSNQLWGSVDKKQCRQNRSSAEGSNIANGTLENYK